MTTTERITLTIGLALIAILAVLAGSAHGSVASVFDIRKEPKLGCWPWTPRALPPGYYVAHKTLPCGTRLRVCYQRRCVRATVRDRGPYIAGRDYDLDRRVQLALRMPFGVYPVTVTR